MDLRNSVLIVDDEYIIVLGLTIQMEDIGMQVCASAATAEEAISLAQEHRPAVVLMDMRLRGEKDGVDAALAIHELVGSKVIFLTGSREPSTLARIGLDHASAVLFKPASDSQLRSAIEAARGD